MPQPLKVSQYMGQKEMSTGHRYESREGRQAGGMTLIL